MVIALPNLHVLFLGLAFLAWAWRSRDIVGDGLMGIDDILWIRDRVGMDIEQDEWLETLKE